MRMDYRVEDGFRIGLRIRLNIIKVVPLIALLDITSPLPPPLPPHSPLPPSPPPSLPPPLPPSLPPLPRTNPRENHGRMARTVFASIFTNCWILRYTIRTLMSISGSLQEDSCSERTERDSWARRRVRERTGREGEGVVQGEESR